MLMPQAAPSIAVLRWLLAFAIALAFFYNLHAVPLFDLDEGAFSEATREMLLRGDFVSTYLNAVPRYDKPILIYWLQAASVGVLGLNEFALRLPSALAASAWVGGVYWIVRDVRDERTALWAALIMATCVEIPIMGKAATADALLNLWIATAMLFAYRHFARGAQRDLYLTYACMGLGLLTKGPVAVVVPGAVTAIYCLSAGRVRDWLRAVLHPGGIALMLAIALPWYIAQYLKEGQAFIDGFFLKHNVGRFSDAMEKHGGGPWYYFPVVLIGMLPYTALIFRAAAQPRALWNDELLRYALIWFLFVFVFFSLAGTKLPHYVVYGYGGLAIIMAAMMAKPPRALWFALPALLLFAVLLALPELLDHVQPQIRDRYVRSMLQGHEAQFGAAWRIYFALCCAAAIYFVIDKRLHVEWKALALGFLTIFAVSRFLMPTVAALQQQPIKDAARMAKDYPGPLVMHRLNTPSFNVYTQRLTERRDPQPGDLVLTKSIHVPDLGEVEVIFERHGIALVRIQ